MKSELTCRACLQTAAEMISLCLDFSNDDTHKTIAEVLEECTSVKVKMESQLPKLICSECLQQLRKVEQFRSKCQRTDRLLKEQIQVCQIKNEDGDTKKINRVDPTVSTEENVDDVKAEEQIPSPTEVNPLDDNNSNESIVKRKYILKNKQRKFLKRNKENKIKPKIKMKNSIRERVQNENSDGKGKVKYVRRTYKCEVCDKVLARRQSYKNHMNKHNDVREHVCSICSKRYTGLKYLQDHLKRHNREQYKYLCPECGRKFISSTDLKIHQRRHANIKLYECDICQRSLSSSDGLRQHKERHTGTQQYACDMCPKRFTTKSNLRWHKFSHTGIKPFECSYCNRGYSTASVLRVHMRSHTGDRPFECHICSRSFALGHTLNAHMRTHTGAKPFECPLCKQRFGHKANMSRHIKKTHKVTGKNEHVSTNESDGMLIPSNNLQTITLCNLGDLSNNLGVNMLANTF